MKTNMATVEVLTAEVRVLMVGSRQVTLSVAKQLDWVPADKIKPFGRVRIGKTEWNVVEVIGVHIDSGVLVRGRERNPGRCLCDKCAPRRTQGARNSDPWTEEDHDIREEEATIFRLWKELPLIVLAGLR